jgi:hypothetical protein
MDIATKQKAKKELQLYNTTNQLDLPRIYRPLHSTAPEYTLQYSFFSRTYETFFRVEHMLSCTSNFSMCEDLYSTKYVHHKKVKQGLSGGWYLWEGEI